MSLYEIRGNVALLQLIHMTVLTALQAEERLLTVIRP